MTEALIRLLPVHGSEGDAVTALETEDFPRFGGARGFVTHFGEDALDLLDLLGIRSRKDAAFDEKAVLEPDADIAAEQRRLRQKGLRTPGIKGATDQPVAPD